MDSYSFYQAIKIIIKLQRNQDNIQTSMASKTFMIQVHGILDGLLGKGRIREPEAAINGRNKGALVRTKFRGTQSGIRDRRGSNLPPGARVV